MSTTTFPRRTKPVDSMVPASRRPKRRHWRWGVSALAALLALWFLPGLLARTPVVRWAVESAAADLHGSVAIDSVSLGWFSPVRARGIRLDDEHQQQVLEIPRAESSRTLLGLLWDRSRLGTFRLVEPKLAVTFQDGTSNLEQILAEYLKPSDDPAAAVDLVLEVVDASVTVTDVDRARSWDIERLRLDLRVPAGGAPLELTASGVVADAKQAGRFDLALQMPAARPEEKRLAELAASGGDGESDVDPEAGITAQFSAESFPLALVEPLLVRFQPGLHLGGLLTAEVDAALGGGPVLLRGLKTKATARDFHLAAPALGGDRIELAHVAFEGEAAGRGTELVVRRSTLECDLGQFALTGSVDLADESVRAMPGALAAQVFELEGTVDLARLAASMPETLQLRPGMQVTSGQVQFALQSDRGAAGMAWQGRLSSSDLKALDGGRELVWDQPVELIFAAQETAEGPLAGELRCRSDFLKLHAVGTTRQVSADATFSLDRLAEQLGQFVDLGALGLAGEGWSHFTWRHAPDGTFETEMELHVSRLRVALPDRQPWQEPELIAFASASGHADLDADARIEAATLHVAAGAERIEAKLLRPVLDLADGGTWPMAVQMHGELAHWPPRLAMVCDLREYPAAGRYDLAGQVTLSRRNIHAAETVVRVDALD
ncbi:MAG: hypothetical protein ACOCWL_04085, partial [Thermoguttaceae bacterium]